MNLKNYKGPVRLRGRRLTDGSLSLYLDIYHQGKREYRFLRLYLSPEGGHRNREILRLAEQQKAETTLNLYLNDKSRPTPRHPSPTLNEWMTEYAGRKGQTGRSLCYSIQIMKTLRHLKLCHPKEIPLTDLSVTLCIRFIRHLRESDLAQATIAAYTRCLNCALNEACKEGLLHSNPMKRLPKSLRPIVGESKREYLTLEELRILAVTPTSDNRIIKAFLFACFTGLRLSDIKRLRKENIKCREDGWHLEIEMQKTGKRLTLPLSTEAVKWLSIPQESSMYLFPLPTDTYTNRIIKRWIGKAGILKHITFHSSRHTHANLLIESGADIYTVSKILGHSNVRTTEIYARSSEKRKREAVDRLPSI